MRPDYTTLDRRSIASTGLGTSPQAVQFVEDLQAAAYTDGPADTAVAQQAATTAQATGEAAQATGEVAQSTAEFAQGSANAAMARADDAYDRADDAYDLADTKVEKDAGPTFSAPLATPSRAPLPAYAGGTAAATYTQADVQALTDQVAALSKTVAALVIDGRANHSLTP